MLVQSHQDELAARDQHMQNMHTKHYVIQSTQTMFIMLPMFAHSVSYVMLQLFLGHVLINYAAAASSQHYQFGYIEQVAGRDGAYPPNLKSGGGAPLTALCQAIRERERLHVDFLPRVDVARDNFYHKFKLVKNMTTDETSRRERRLEEEKKAALRDYLSAKSMFEDRFFATLVRGRMAPAGYGK